MKRLTQVFVIGSAALLFTTAAQAQVTSNSQAGIAAPVAGVNITLTGTLQSAIVLTVSGTSNNVLSPDVQNMPTRAAGTFAFGSFNTAQATALANGRLVRAGTGAFAVAALSARVTITGSANNGSVLMTTVADAVGTSPVANGTTRFSPTPAAWTAAADGTVLNVGAAGQQFCPTGGCVNATDYLHDLAVYIPDTQAPGTFAQVIRYDASIL